MTTEEAARELDCTPKHVRSLCRQGRLEGGQVNGRGDWRIDLRSVRRYRYGLAWMQPGPQRELATAALLIRELAAGGQLSEDIAQAAAWLQEELDGLPWRPASRGLGEVPP